MNSSIISISAQIFSFTISSNHEVVERSIEEFADHWIQCIGVWSFNKKATGYNIGFYQFTWNKFILFLLQDAHPIQNRHFEAGSVATLYLILGSSSWVCSFWDSKDSSRGSSILLTNPNWRRFSSTTGSPSMHSMSCFLHWSSWERDVTLTTSLFRQNSTSRP